MIENPDLAGIQQGEGSGMFYMLPKNMLQETNYTD